MLDSAQGRAIRRDKFLTNSNKNKNKTKQNKQRSGQRNRPNNNSTRMTKTSSPSYKILPGGGMTISHREFISTINDDIIGAGSITPGTKRVLHTPLKVPINPGDGRAFPWLNQIATRFEKYTIRKLHYIYEPTCATTTSGGIALCPVYDPADPLPDSRTALLNAEGVVRGAVHNELKLVVPSRRLRQGDTLFVRATHESLVDANELRLSDVGYIAVAISDSTVDLNYGDLFVEYTIDLTSPRVGPRVGKSAAIIRENYISTSATANESLFDSGANGGPSVGSRLHHSPASTLMIECDHTKDHFKLGGVNVETSQVVFQEPFTGQMQIRGKSNVPPAAILDVVVNDNAWTKTAPTKPWAIVDQVQQIGNAAGQVMALYNVVAEVGDVIDMAFQGGYVGGLLDYMAVTFMDLAPELLPLLIL